MKPCRYEKGPWSECEPKTNMRTRTLTLKDRKKGDATAAAANCEPTKTIQKKCKKDCYAILKKTSLGVMTGLSFIY
ncbi:hypothetical protein J6590_006431 [Homalodisca vitripennis]|nr:hypothetical protein J6590_006431 [Homalodisca vitripennis]